MRVRRQPMCPALRTVSVLPTCRATWCYSVAPQSPLKIETPGVCLVPESRAICTTARKDLKIFQC